jgi:hypothetical protein
MPEELPLTEAQQAELDRRLNAYRLNSKEGSPLKYVKENILKKVPKNSLTSVGDHYCISPETKGDET